MKKVILIFVVALAFASCAKKAEPAPVVEDTIPAVTVDSVATDSVASDSTVAVQ